MSPFYDTLLGKSGPRPMEDPSKENHRRDKFKLRKVNLIAVNRTD